MIVVMHVNAIACGAMNPDHSNPNPNRFHELYDQSCVPLALSRYCWPQLSLALDKLRDTRLASKTKDGSLVVVTHVLELCRRERRYPKITKLRRSLRVQA